MKLGKVNGRKLSCYLCRHDLEIKVGDDGPAILERHLREDHHRLLLTREETSYGSGVFVYKGRYVPEDLPAFLYR